jgi:integrase
LNEKGEKIPNQGKEIGWSDLKILQAMIREFGLRKVNLITGEEWAEWALKQNSGNVPATIVRYMAPVKAFLRWCSGGNRKWLEMPEIELPEAPLSRHRKRRRVAELTQDLLVFFFSFAAPHLKAQLYTEWSTGGRLSSVLFGCRLCDLILSPQRSQITFHDTKNGDPVTAYLHPAAAEALAEYLEHRGRPDRREDLLFLTHRGRPYSTRGRERGWSGFNKTAFNAAKRRAVKAKRRQAAAARVAGDFEKARMLWSDAALLRQVTQHWLRHWFATHALAAGMSLEAIAAQGGWRNYRSIEAYAHDVPEARRRALDNLPIGARAIGKSLTRGSHGGR